MIRLANLEETNSLVAFTEELYPEDICPTHELRRILRQNPCWVYDDNGIQATLINEVSKGQPYIWSCAVKPAFRKRGIATAMLNEFEKYYTGKDYTYLWLHTRYDNPAQKLYFDCGYRITSFERNIYGSGQHGLIMKKHLF